MEAELESWREPQESEGLWALRRRFLERNRAGFEGEAAQRRLQALSQAWANHLSMGCRYSPQVMEKILQMAEGIDVGEMPSFELVPDSKAKKRPRSPLQDASSHSLEAPRKQAPKFRARPRFEPIHFVASNAQDKVKDQPLENQAQPAGNKITTQQIQNYADRVFSSFSNQDGDSLLPRSTGLGYGSSQPEDKAASKNTSVPSVVSSVVPSVVPSIVPSVLPSIAAAASEPSAPQSVSETFPKKVISGKQTFINKLLTAVRMYLASAQTGGGSEKINYTYLLTRSIQACKTNPEYIYSPVKDLSPADLPESKKHLKDGFACEVRCQDVYLATGYAGSKNGSRDRATELAVLLLQKPVEVQVAQRKFKGAPREDLVLCERDKTPLEFPPSLKQLDSPIVAAKEASPGEPSSDPLQGPSSGKHWTNFVLTENASDSIGILNNSAIFNKMSVEYKYTLLQNRLWRCSVFLEDHCLATGFGTKKTSKHAAADEALRILQKTQSNAGGNKPALIQTVCGRTFRGSKKDLKDLVIYENSLNPVCTLNDTAQFNKITVDYVFERMTGLRWKCKVMLEDKLIAEAVDVKKTVKHLAAEEAVKVLKKTQPTVVNHFKKGTVEDVISRNEIRGHSANEALKQQIKEDNIGNQILRKMGWTGGGLGKTGEGIREPIAVKEQFKREGLGMDVARGGSKITKKDIDKIIQNYAFSDSNVDLTFSTELTNDERKQIHQIAQKYGLKSKSHGQGRNRYLVVSRKRRKEDLLDQLKQDGQVGHYELIMPQDK